MELENLGEEMAKFSLSSQHFPSFFKIYLPEHNPTRLLIPPDFISNFNGVVPKKASIKNRLGKFWYVEMEEACGNLFITKGWEDYVIDHTLTRGDFLIFTYTGNSVFSVRVFGMNGCIKPEPVDKGNDLSHEEFEHITTQHVSRRQKKVSTTTVNQKIVWGQKGKFTKKEIRRVEAAFECRKPSFVVKIQPSHVGCNFRVSVPHAFSATYLKDCAVVKFHCSKGKTWPVTCTVWNKTMRLCGGWRDFALSNNLQEGDICVFELIEGTPEPSFKVGVVPSVSEDDSENCSEDL